MLSKKQETDLALIATRTSTDPATQTTLAAILAKLIAAPATETTLAAILAKLIAAPATSALQTAGNNSLSQIATSSANTDASTQKLGDLTDLVGLRVSSGYVNFAASFGASGTEIDLTTFNIGGEWGQVKRMFISAYATSVTGTVVVSIVDISANGFTAVPMIDTTGATVNSISLVTGNDRKIYTRQEALIAAPKLTIPSALGAGKSIQFLINVQF